MTTRGDLIRGGAAGAAERVAAVAADTFVGGDGTDITTRTAAQARTSLDLDLSATGSALHRWRLDEGTGTSFADVGSANQALTLTGAEARVTAPGIRGSGIRFDGTATNYLKTIDSPATPTAGSFTLHGWVRPASVVAGYQVFCHKARSPTAWGPTYVGASIGKHAAAGAWYISSAPGGVDTPLILSADQWQLREGVWVHLAMTYDGAVERAYMDGVLAGSLAAVGDTTWDTGPWVLGGNATEPGSWALATLSDWRVQSGVLSAAQLAEIYQRGVRRFA